MVAVGFLSPASGVFLHSHSPRCHHGRCDSSSSTPQVSQLLFPLRCSGEAELEVVSNEDVSPPPTSEIPIGTPKKSPSLISTINVQKSIRGIEITNVEYYGRLGIARGDSYDKVNSAYQKLCEEVVNQGLDEEETNKSLVLLKESYAILSSEEERRLYDWSLARNEMPDRDRKGLVKAWLSIRLYFKLAIAGLSRGSEGFFISLSLLPLVLLLHSVTG